MTTPASGPNFTPAPYLRDETIGALPPAGPVRDCDGITAEPPDPLMIVMPTENDARACLLSRIGPRVPLVMLGPGGDFTRKIYSRKGKKCHANLKKASG